MTKVSNDDTPRNGERIQTSKSNRPEEPQLVEDGGVDSIPVIYERVQHSAREWLSSPIQTLRNQSESLNRIEVLLYCLFGSSVLGLIAGLTATISPAVLTSFGIGVFFLTLLALAVILLRQSSSEQDPSSASWAKENRPPIRRRR